MPFLLCPASPAELSRKCHEKRSLWPTTAILAPLRLPRTTSFTPSTPTAQTRGVAGLWQRLCGPNPKLDSVYIFQPYKGWGGGLIYEMAENGAMIDSREDFYDGDYHSVIDFSLVMDSRVAHSLGANVMFGPIQLGFLREVGSVEKRNRTFAFRWIANFFALDVRYKDFFSTPGGTVSIEVLSPEEQAEKMDPIPIASTRMAESRSLVVNGIYAFNRHCFSYRAAYNSRAIQRRSAGSFIVGAKYMYGATVIDSQDVTVIALSNGLGRFTTHEISVGAGYSFNWVPYHRDAAGSKDLRGLRNLTLNITAVPLLTFYNRVISEAYAEDGYFRYKDEIARRYFLNGRIMPNFTARAGICYSTGHFYATLGGEYTRFGFRLKPKEQTSAGGVRTSLVQQGMFSSWNVNLRLNYRF